MNDRPKRYRSTTRVWKPDGSSSSRAPRPADPNASSSYRRPARSPRPGGQPRRGKRVPYSAKERRKKREGFGRLYVDKQIRLQTPMVFETYDGPIEALIARRLCYDFDLNVNGEIERLNKLPIKYMYKKADKTLVQRAVQYNERVRNQRLEPIKTRSERFRINTLHLAYARKKERLIRVTMRGGEALEGWIDWYSYFEVKMRLGKKTPSVVLFRHAAYAFEMEGGMPRRSGPPRRPETNTPTRNPASLPPTTDGVERNMQ